MTVRPKVFQRKRDRLRRSGPEWERKWMAAALLYQAGQSSARRSQAQTWLAGDGDFDFVADGYGGRWLGGKRAASGCGGRECGRLASGRRAWQAESSCVNGRWWIGFDAKYLLARVFALGGRRVGV